MVKKTNSQFVTEVENLVGNEYVFLEEYVDAKTPILCRHTKCGHEWKIAPSNFLFGKRCPGCCKTRNRYTLDDARKLFAQKGLILLAEKYESANVKMPFICAKHRDKGIQYKTLSSITNGNTGCRFCGNEITRKKQIDPSLYAEMKQCFLDHDLELLDYEYKGVNAWYKCKCLTNSKHGTFYKRYIDVKSQDQGCPRCGHDHLRKSRRKSESYYKNIVENNGYIFVGINYRHRNNGGTEIFYICPRHREYGVQVKRVSKIKTQGCPYCSESQGERYIRKYLNNHHIKHETQKSFRSLRGVGNALLSYDFYLPDYRLLIEFQGIQHETPIDFFGGERQLKIQQEHDRRKREYAKRHGYKLLEIWYHDIEKIAERLDEHLLIYQEVS